ncbi:MAG TPA: ABC transporter permease [Candidatus Saccharimonadia bacterium]|nr:ABC transporter permease [Candidatus Saccharimonadia bacterium]
MRLIDIFTTASGNMFRSKLRTSLTILAIFIGSFTLTLTSGLGTGISSYIDKQVNNLGAKDVMLIQAADTSDDGPGGGDSGPKPYNPAKKISATAFGTATTVLTNADIAKVKQVPGIKSVEPNLVVTPDYIVGTNSKKYQVSANPYITGTNIDLAAGSQLSNAATEYDALLPVEYVSVLGYASNQAAVGQSITLGISDGTGTQHQITATIRGVQQKGLTNSGGMNTNTALTNALFKAQTIGLPAAVTNSYQALIAKFDSGYTDAQITTLKDDLKKHDYKGTTFQDQIGTFKQVIRGIILVLDAFAIIALLAASFGIINTLLMSVQERTKEIGLMKAMGMSGPRIFLLFSTEAVMLGLWGSLIGGGVAIVVGHIANAIVAKGFLKDLVGLQLLTFPPAQVAGIVGIVMAIAFLAGTLPAFRAARQSPIDSLRYE